MSGLQPLYEARERLEQAAIAGTALLEEDFRLKKAVERMKPLAQASPVFAKFFTGLEKLLSAPEADRAGLLLDLLALADAVAYTQGKTGAEGELEPLSVGIGKYQELSYGQLLPLTAALTGTGGGRMETVQGIWTEHPEFFGDYRVLPLLVRGLGDKFSYLAELNRKILVQLGSAALPALKDGFDPAGKAEMVRRVEAIEGIAGAAENGFYLEMLPKAKRDIQGALIRALRHDPANGPRLVELCRTKKGDTRDAASWALVRSSAPEAREYFESLALEHSDQVLKDLRDVPGEVEWANRLTARLFQGELDRLAAYPDLPLTFETQDRFRLLLNALCWKTGEEVWEVFRQAASMEERLSQPREDTGAPMAFELSFGLRQAAKDWHDFCPTLAQVLEGLLMRRPQNPEVRALALELYEKYGQHYLAAALLAQLYTLDSADCYAWGAAQLYPAAPGGGVLDQGAVDAFCRVFTSGVRWSPERGQYEISPLWHWGYERAEFITPIAPLDPRWFGRFAAAGAHMKHIILNLLREQKNRPDILEQMGSYLYYVATTDRNPNTTEMYIQVLAGLGWTDWKDFFVKRAAFTGEFLYLELKMGMEAMPVPLEEKISQLDQLTALAKENKVTIRYQGWPEEKLRGWIEQWRAQEN